MNKRAFLLGEETVKIIVAVICVVFLVAILASIYFSATGSQKSKEAQSIVNGENGLAKEITRINSDGTPNEQGFLIPNPSGWYLYSFTGDKKPNLCAGANCICVCGNVLVDLFNAQTKECDKKGVCVIVENLNTFEKIKIEKSGIYLLIKKTNGILEVTKK